MLRLPHDLPSAWLLAGLLLLPACDPSGADPADAETRTLRATEARIAADLEATYGPSARVQRIYGTGSSVLLGVAQEELVPDSDVVPAVAVAAFDPETGALQPITQDASYREALAVGERVALVTDAGDLVLRERDGRERLLLQGVRGDLAASADGKHILLTLGTLNDEDLTSVAVTDLEGNVRVLADGPGVDNRPTLSPDGETVVFVSGRTGIASFYRTTLQGDEPVQITNAHIKAGVPRGSAPAGFIPPPVRGDQVEWLSDDVIRYDAGGGELWTLNVRSGAGAVVGGAK